MKTQLFLLTLLFIGSLTGLRAESWSQNFTAPTGGKGTLTVDFKANIPTPCRPLFAQMDNRQFTAAEVNDILGQLRHYVVMPEGDLIPITITVDVRGGGKPFDNLLQGYWQGRYFSKPMIYAFSPFESSHIYTVDILMDRNVIYAEQPGRIFEFLLRSIDQTQITRTFAINWIVVGSQWESYPSWTTATPELPHLILRDPPGSGSYAYVEENQQICQGFGISLAQDASATAFVQAQVGKKGSAGILVEAEYEAYASVEASLSVGITRNEDRSYNMCFETSQRFETDQSNSFLVGQRGDVYLTMATKYKYGLAKRVFMDNCEPIYQKNLMFIPEQVLVSRRYTDYALRKVVLPRLRDSLAAAQASGTPAVVQTLTDQ
ncbi:MAG: hypothetical protein AAFZ52_09565, partial [Bacteroidota bacterium]